MALGQLMKMMNKISTPIFLNLNNRNVRTMERSSISLTLLNGRKLMIKLKKLESYVTPINTSSVSNLKTTTRFFLVPRINSRLLRSKSSRILLISNFSQMIIQKNRMSFSQYCLPVSCMD